MKSNNIGKHVIVCGDRINLAYECWQRSTIEEHEVE